MSKDKLTDYSAIAASNTDIGGINVNEGMLPSNVNNALREQMSHLADFAAGTTGINVLNLQDDDASHSIKIQAPATVTATTTFTLPDGDGSANQVLTTDGSGTLSWGDSIQSFTLYEYTATADQTTFTGSDDNAATLTYTAGSIIVFMNGVALDPSDYTATNGTSLVLSSGAALNDIVNIIAFSAFTVADTVSASAGGTFNADVKVLGNVGIGTSSPAKTLDIDGQLRIRNGGATGYGLLEYGTSSTATNNWHVGSEGDGSFRFYNGNFGAGSEAMRINSSGTVTATAFSGDGSGLSNVGGNPPTIQAFTSSGTWTKPTGCKTIKVTVVGGGGGGGSAQGQDSACNVAAGGGGAGGGAIEFIDVTAVSSVTVTIGAGGSGGTNGGGGNSGGTTSFGAYCTATGGGGGQGITTTGNQCGHGGDGGVGASGNINIEGGNGHHAQLVSGGLPVSGAGGVSLFGGGGQRIYRGSTGGTVGEAGTLGGGGSGSATRDQASSKDGGAGGAGIVVVEEYY